MTDTEETAAATEIPAPEPGDGGPTKVGGGNRQTLVDIAEGFRSSQEGGGEEEAPAKKSRKSSKSSAAPALDES